MDASLSVRQRGRGRSPARADNNPIRDTRKPKESAVKNFVFAALAVLGLALATASMATPANAYYSFAPPNQNNDS